MPLLATDLYGKFIPGPNGYAQVVTSDGLVEANPAANGGLEHPAYERVARTVMRS